jgi:flagellar biosynthesis chaperone FliJ
MRTRFSSLVTLKKSTLERSERVMQRANADLNSANIALQLSYDSLENIKSPTSGSITDLVASRVLMSSARDSITHNKAWIAFATSQVIQAKEQLKLDMIAFEKFKYLELEEMKVIIKQKQIQEAKDLDEVALMTYGRKGKK